MTEWRDVKGFEGLYEVSDCAGIRQAGPNGKVLSAFKDKYGYLRTRLTKDKKRWNKFVHRIVADAFLENPDNKAEVHHKNSVRTADEMFNLEWVTRTENEHKKEQRV